MTQPFKITLRNDYAFKRVFGVEENKDVLQDLIEIQNRWHFDFPERTLYYWSKMYNEGVKQGQDYTKLPKCITINLIGEGFNKNKRLHNKYVILEQDTKEPLVSKLEIHILNLEKARLLKEGQCKDNKTKRLLNWLKFIETDNPEVRKMLAETSKVMAKANDKIIVMEMSPKEKWLYDSRMKYENDRASCISEGYREGVAQGISQGAYQNKLETAKMMKLEAFDINMITKMTGLSIEEIEAL
ncbi:Rpn family recombination-promoting nuclease/putative transposase [Treponema sp. OMZ 787]|uniref:Rpn family recombination-promoting nuclease/putative transposase n=1 Tax=Treponema sp. OMZ 787 TaxID=2563669 RepID=UPI0020A4F12C|nr:Rpn family recombination-promoting nuclease/putative transposase [Treponema sp. OMZ 787]UTC62690.1 Rpn family recombination-promoting nuclease/putative transposase [Treponema sp. OMZ 787]